MKTTNECRVELIESMGTDLTVVNAARVSFNKESDFERAGKLEEEFLPKKDVKLIKYLARHGHWTPFGHPQIMIRETVPIFVARQRFKHVVGFVYNEVSRRYVDDEPEFFVPDEWRGKPENAKQGSSDDTKDEPHVWLDEDYFYEDLLDIADSLYQNAIGRGIAPEQARMMLPQSIMTSYYVTGSLAAWARAYKQRSDSHAQKEIQDLAKKWDEIIRPMFPVSWPELTQ